MVVQCRGSLNEKHKLGLSKVVQKCLFAKLVEEIELSLASVVEETTPMSP